MKHYLTILLVALTMTTMAKSPIKSINSNGVYHTQEKKTTKQKLTTTLLVGGFTALATGYQMQKFAEQMPVESQLSINNNNNPFYNTTTMKTVKHIGLSMLTVGIVLKF
jgi:NADH dehydrogenase FAD-containing subunit